MAEIKYPKVRPRVADLFCGAGGMSLGFEQAGFHIAVGIEVDGHHAAAHHRNFPYSKTVCASVTSIDAAKMRELAGGEEIDVIIGGPPCQGFSNMGHRDAADPRNTLIGEFARIVLDVRPKAFVMENVPAMLAGDTRPLLNGVIEQLEAGGYRITKPLRILTASNFGVPQARSRLFVLGLREDIPGRIEYPDGPCAGQPPRPSVLEAIRDLPDVESHRELFIEDQVNYDKRPYVSYATAARGVERDASDLSYPRKWNRKSCSGCLRTKHNPNSSALYAATPPGAMVPGHKLPRLDPNGLAPTLRAGSDSTRGSYTAPRPIHPLLPRCITTREAARLHGYPDWFMFFPTKWHAYKQVGNSVCPPVGRAVAAQVLLALSAKLTGVAPTEIELTDDFHLPEDRPKQHRRIPQVREYPRVVAHLFLARFDAKKRKLTNGRFTFADVQAAIAATGANISWTREDTFVSEIARSRNVKALLAAPLTRGFSLRKLDGAPWIGEFVPIGTPGTIEEKSGDTIRIDDLTNAIRIAMPLRSIADLSVSVGGLLDDPNVREEIWPRDVTAVELDGQGRQQSSRIRFVRVSRAGGKVQTCAILLSSPENVPNLLQIERALTRERLSEIVAVTPLTARHLLISRFVRENKAIKEVARRVFYFGGTAAGRTGQMLLFS